LYKSLVIGTLYIAMKKIYKLTQQGIDELKAEQKLLLDGRDELTERIAVARDLGDLSENAEYQSARDEQKRKELRISEIEHTIKNAELIKLPTDNSTVVLGNSVTLKAENGKTKKFQIVGTVEASPLDGKISDDSPIGKALLGAKLGQTLEITTPVETAEYTIESIE
jgi:transcription elongation factor GreA